MVLKARKNLTTHTQKTSEKKVEAQAKKVHVWRKTQKSTRTQLLVLSDSIIVAVANDCMVAQGTSFRKPHPEVSATKVGLGG